VDHEKDLYTADPVFPEGMTDDRVRDNWRPLLAIADIFGGRWPARARAAMVDNVAQQSADQKLSEREQLLADIKTVFERMEDRFLVSPMLCSGLHTMEDRPWAEYGKRGKPINAKQLAGLLKDFAIKPEHTEQGNGYFIKQFEDAFLRYVPEPMTFTQNKRPPETPSQPSAGGQDIEKKGQIAEPYPSGSLQQPSDPSAGDPDAWSYNNE
jgi:hypothetical protein